jgi:hypothetical protein
MEMHFNCYDSAKHEERVNNAEWTHNFQDIATESNEEEMIALFEEEIDFDTVDDLVGLNVYFKRGELVAYYDYENATGSNKL